jgi:tetratricopeptide (TPR) repeat protein
MIILVVSLLTAFEMQGSDAYRLNREGRNLLDQHRYAAAACVFRVAVDKAGSELGAEDPATAMMLRNLALAYVQTGDFAAAEQAAKLAYAVIESRFGPADPALTPILNVLAEGYAGSGRIDEAERVSEQAVSIGPLAGAHYGIALQNLGALREYSGDLTGAAALYRRALAVKIEALGAAHPHVALARAALRRVEQQRNVAGNVRQENKAIWPLINADER